MATFFVDDDRPTPRCIEHVPEEQRPVNRNRFLESSGLPLTSVSPSGTLLSAMVPRRPIMEVEENPPQEPVCPSRPACPVCGGVLIEIRAKLQCSRCHTICETCCEGGRG